MFKEKNSVVLRCLSVRNVVEKTRGGTIVLTNLNLKHKDTKSNKILSSTFIDTRLGNKSFKFQGFAGSIAKAYNYPVYNCLLLQSFATHFFAVSLRGLYRLITCGIRSRTKVLIPLIRGRLPGSQKQVASN